MRMFLPALLICILTLVNPTSLTVAKGGAQTADISASESQKAFAAMKNLAGEWEGCVTAPEMPQLHQLFHVSLRVTSRGHVLGHEFQEAGTPLDPTKYDHPVTMLYVDGEQLTLVHYCDAGNRPRMIGKMSRDGKTVGFELKDISGSIENHMHQALFTIIDANHHAEDWTFMMKDKMIHAHYDLQRKS